MRIQIQSVNTLRYFNASSSTINVKLMFKVIIAIEMIAVVKNHFVMRCLIPKTTVFTLNFADLN